MARFRLPILWNRIWFGTGGSRAFSFVGEKELSIRRNWLEFSPTGQRPVARGLASSRYRNPWPWVVSGFKTAWHLGRGYPCSNGRVLVERPDAFVCCRESVAFRRSDCGWLLIQQALATRSFEKLANSFERIFARHISPLPRLRRIHRELRNGIAFWLSLSAMGASYAPGSCTLRSGRCNLCRLRSLEGCPYFSVRKI